MKEIVTLAKDVGAKKDFSSTKNNKSVHRARNELEMQLGSLGGMMGNIRCDGGKPSVEGIATQLSGMHTVQRTHVLLTIQQTHGNRYVQRVVEGIQANLVVGQPGDVYEQEADRVADEVMQMPQPQAVFSVALSVQGTLPPWEEEELGPQPIGEEEEEEFLQTKEISGQNAETSLDLESRINAIRGGGQPLAESERAFFEPRFGYDFGRVRVHNNGSACRYASS